MAAERDSLQTILSRDSGSASEVDKEYEKIKKMFGLRQVVRLGDGEKENSPAMNVFDRLGPVGNKKGTSILDYWETLNKKKEEAKNRRGPILRSALRAELRESNLTERRVTQIPTDIARGRKLQTHRRTYSSSTLPLRRKKTSVSTRSFMKSKIIRKTDKSKSSKSTRAKKGHTRTATSIQATSTHTTSTKPKSRRPIHSRTLTRLVNFSKLNRKPCTPIATTITKSSNPKTSKTANKPVNTSSMPRHRRSAKTLTSLPKTLASKASESRALASSSKSKVKLSRARVPMVTNRTLRKTPRRFRTPSRRLTRTVSGNTKSRKRGEGKRRRDRVEQEGNESKRRRSGNLSKMASAPEASKKV
ncbi:hypothetical protein AAMO2058_001539800 [Amorphochlora amoebiformis]